MSQIMSLAEFTNAAAKLADALPGVIVQSYQNVVDNLRAYHAQAKDTPQEFKQLTLLNRSVMDYIDRKSTSRTQAMATLLHEFRSGLTGMSQ